MSTSDDAPRDARPTPGTIGRGAGRGAGADVERALRIAVIAAHDASAARLLARALTEAGVRASVADASSTDPAEPTLRDADAAVVLDATSLGRARDLGVPVCAVVLPRFDVGWSGDLREADAVLVAHEEIAAILRQRGVADHVVEVVGPLAAEAFDVHLDAAALPSTPGAGEHLIVPTALLEAEGPHRLLSVLASIPGAPTFVFDVGDDVRAADLVRRLGPVHGIHGYLVARGAAQIAAYRCADLVLARARGEEVTLALSAGVGLVLLPPGRSETTAFDALVRAGVATPCRELAELPTQIPDLLETERARSLAEAAAALDAPGSAARVASAVIRTWSRLRDEGRVMARGLPVGFEPLAPPMAERSRTRPPPSTLDDAIERELAALKKQLGDR